MKKPKADFDYYYIRNILCIEDQNLGNTSVTNCIEDIVDYIIYPTNDPPLVVVYRDSMRIWDGWDHKNQKFISLNCFELDEALTKIQDLCLK